ncbi:MAG TPA: HEPN domain-containing protein [Desulfobacterales bacterium]
MRPPEEVKKVLVGQWLAKAEQDMKAGEALLALDPPYLYPACFHAQQAAQKYLKALLTWYQIEFPKTHVIELLLELLKRVDSRTASELQDAGELTPYGVDIRYPGDQPEPELEEAYEAVDLARKVRAAILSRLKGIQ